MATTTTSTDQPSSEFVIQGPVLLGKKLYLCDETADFHFICKSSTGDGHHERVPAHKFLLINTSAVFQAMFNGSWIEKTEVNIVDATADASKEFLQFIYLGKATLTMENVAEVMNLGKKYDVAECFETCAKYLKKHLTNDRICWGYELAAHLEHKQLEHFCETVIKLNSKAALASDSFLKCQRKTVKRILQMEPFNCPEADKFVAVLNWIEAACKQNDLMEDGAARGQFGDLLHEIRFGRMTLQEFAVRDPGTLFTHDEYREIIQMKASDEFRPQIFKENQRNQIESGLWNEDELILYHRYCSEGKPYSIKKVETAAFKVNQPVLLGGIICADLAIYGDNERILSLECMPCELKIFELHGSDDKVEVYNGKDKVALSGTSYIPVKDPILIRPGFEYEIEMEQSPPDGCCTTDLFRHEVHIEPDIIVQFYHDSEEEPELVSQGLIEGIEVNRI